MICASRNQKKRKRNSGKNKKNRFIILEEQSTNVDKEIQWETAYNQSTMNVLELEDGQRRRKITR